MKCIISFKIVSLYKIVIVFHQFLCDDHAIYFLDIYGLSSNDINLIMFVFCFEVHARRLQALKALTYASNTPEILQKLYEIVFGILDKVCSYKHLYIILDFFGLCIAPCLSLFYGTSYRL